MQNVSAVREPLSIRTYDLGVPEKNPLFFEKRVYQGSCGKVYPVPFIDKVYETSKAVEYDAVRLENDYLRLVMLPEIGGRIFIGQDKTNRDYDFFYRQDVIKPALVGLAGPWISGGVEFNWPQHHRPGTYLPADVFIEEEADGARTAWLSEHDPLNRLKGMHGIRVRPGSALIEVRARLFNRTPFTQTFLWWANVAAEVHDHYQSFFPPDVHYVADHAVRAMSSFPVAMNDYYGVDYAHRPGANDLSWYKNIPVPTSYMVCDTQFDFFGGYDHAAQGGFIHVANRHISPGKKQWTWGNHAFGWAWDRELTDRIGVTGRPAPYVELMAGVYTDNQPDFTYLAPYETKTFSQFWWPYQGLGSVQNATKDAAVRLVINPDRTLDLGVAVSRRIDGARIVLQDGDRVLLDERVDLTPEHPWRNQELTFEGDDDQSLQLCVEGVVCYRPIDTGAQERKRELATEPPLPESIETMDELFLTAEHLEQYRHPTRYPELYWDEALRRDPMDARTNIARGRHLLTLGLLEDAVDSFDRAIRRLTRRHPNPYTGEAHYFAGVALRFLGRDEEAYAALYKATWNYAWRAAAYYELALLDCRKGDYEQALEHGEASLDTNRQNNKACILKALARKRCGQDGSEVLAELLNADPLDHWARHASGDTDGVLDASRNDAQTMLDIAYDYADAGFYEDAIAVLELHHGNAVKDVAVPNPMERSALTHYALAWLARDAELLKRARALAPDYLFPSRLHDQLALEWALAQPGEDRNAAYGLGNYFYDRKRHEDAITMWQRSREADPDFATAHRNLGMALWNVRRDAEGARAGYEQALRCDPDDARLVAEFVQLCGKLGDSAESRLAFLESRRDQVVERDDATVELATLYNETAQPSKALEVLTSRRFHPWEGGEGKVLRQYTTARLKLGKAALEAGEPDRALEHFNLALDTPDSLGEKYHLLQAKADVTYWQGKALQALDQPEAAKAKFEAAAAESGDFQSMAVTEYSELTYFKALALRELGRTSEARDVLEAMAAYAEREMTKPAKIDYFATSLPNLLVFDEDIDAARKNQMRHLLDLVEQALPATG